MSPEMKRLAHAEEMAHERARVLAAESIDAELASRDAEWLAGHLGSCPDCSAVAEEYRALHVELHGLSAPETPRDLWARTSAGLDLIDAAAARRSPRSFGTVRAGRRPLISTAVAVGVVVAVAVVSLLVQSPIVNPAPGSTNRTVIALATASSGRPSQAPQAPLTVVDGTSYWIASSGGVYEIRGGTAQCGAADGSCTVADGGGKTLGSVSSDSAVSAVIGPGADEAAVWTDQKIVIMPLAEEPQTVSIDLLTPRPTAVATPTALATPTAASTPTVAPTPATPVETETPASSPAPSAPASTSAPTDAPLPTAAPTASPAAATGTTAEPTAILTGYEIVGPGPEFSPDGSLVAFSARPVDHSTGPDVFIWRSGEQQAQPITSLHSDLFAGWYGGQVLFSEISAAGAAPTASASGSGGSDTVGPTSYVFDPSAGNYRKIDPPMLLPVVDPTGRYLVYWAGTVEFDPVSGLWQPGKGDLHFDSWSDITLEPASFAAVTGTVPIETPAASATPTPAISASAQSSSSLQPTATDTPAVGPSLPPSPTSSVATPTQTPAAEQALPQLLPVASAPGAGQAWVVRWDSLGQNVAVWVADPGSAEVGRLSLFSIDPTTGMVETNEPRLAADNVMAGIAIDDAHLVYTSAVDGKTYMQALPEVPPSTASTPSPTMPGQLPTDAASSGSPAPQATDRPGN